MLIKNGFVITEYANHKGDIRVDGETISELGAGLAPRMGEEVIDASGKVVLPGGVDVHTHMDLDLGNVRVTDDFYTGTVAAAFGGTTTIVDHMAFGPPGCSIGHQVEAYHRLAGNKAVIDYGFHGVLDHVDDAILDELGTLIGEGVTSHKFYLTYGGKISDREVMMLMERAAKLGILLAVHSENDGAIDYLKHKYIAEGKTSPLYHARSRPPESEADAVNRMLLFAHMTGDAPLYIVHCSAKLSLDFVRNARWRGQNRVFVETCPQYLLLDERMYLESDGLKYIMSPPLRKAEDCKALWSAIRDGDVDTIGTDHCPFFYSGAKQRGKDNFSLAPGGAPGVETRMPMLFAQVYSGRMTMEQLVKLCCTTPAKLFGMYPQKGVIAVGSDADLVLIDPNDSGRLSRSMLHERTDYTPYEGMQFNGWPSMTISRGEIIVADGKLLGRQGRGKFLKRGLPDFNVRG